MVLLGLLLLCMAATAEALVGALTSRKEGKQKSLLDIPLSVVDIPLSVVHLIQARGETPKRRAQNRNPLLNLSRKANSVY